MRLARFSVCVAAVAAAQGCSTSDCVDVGLWVGTESLPVTSLSTSGPACQDAAVYSDGAPGFVPRAHDYFILPVRGGSCSIGFELADGRRATKSMVFREVKDGDCPGVYTDFPVQHLDRPAGWDFGSLPDAGDASAGQFDSGDDTAQRDGATQDDRSVPEGGHGALDATLEDGAHASDASADTDSAGKPDGRADQDEGIPDEAAPLSDAQAVDVVDARGDQGADAPTDTGENGERRECEDLLCKRPYLCALSCTGPLISANCCPCEPPAFDRSENNRCADAASE